MGSSESREGKGGKRRWGKEVGEGQKGGKELRVGR